MEEVARSYLGFDHARLWDLLSECATAINDSPAPALDGRSPFEVLIGQTPLRPLELLTGTAIQGMADVHDRIKSLRVARREVTECLRNAAAAMAHHANRKRRPIPAALQPGSLVWVKIDRGVVYACPCSEPR